MRNAVDNLKSEMKDMEKLGYLYENEPIKFPNM